MSAESFLLPKDPCLRWPMLLPTFRRQARPNPNGRTQYLFWARNAIYHGLSVLGVSPGDNVLVPSFHCTSVVEPILRYGAKVKFYEVGRDLQPDFVDVESKIDQKTRALLAIHYFGFPQPMRSLKKLCKDRCIYFIEDCAHVLVGNGEDGSLLGSTGDISIFSWRKFLPLYDGGQLVINNSGLEVNIRLEKEGYIFKLKVAKNILDKLIDDSENKMIRRMATASRWPSLVARRIACNNGHSPKAFSVNSYDLDFDLASANLGMSSLSRYILHNIDIDDVVVKRRENYACLLDSIKSLRGVTPLHPSLPQHVCPWVFPLLVDEIKDFHLILRDKGIPAFTWSGVIHRDLALHQFPNSKFFYDSLIFLPVHQSINQEQIHRMIEILASELKTATTTATNQTVPW